MTKAKPPKPIVMMCNPKLTFIGMKLDTSLANRMKNYAFERNLTLSDLCREIFLDWEDNLDED